MRSGLHELTDPERPRTDGAVHWCCYARVGQIERHLLIDGAGVIELCDRLGAVRGENVDLLLRGDQSGLAVLKLRDLLAQCGVGLLGALDRAGAGLHQPVITGLFFPRELQIGFGGGDASGFLFDDRLLQGDLGIEVAHRGFRRRDIGMGLVECGLEVAIVDPGQQLSRCDRLVVAHQHLGKIAGHPRRDDRGVGFDIGVIGRFQIPPGREIAVAKVRRTGDPKVSTSARAARLTACRDGRNRVFVCESAT